LKRRVAKGVREKHPGRRELKRFGRQKKRRKPGKKRAMGGSKRRRKKRICPSVGRTED